MRRPYPRTTRPPRVRRAACAEAVDRLLADLGIPGRTVATVILAGPSAAGRYALRVNGRRACLATGDLEEIIADVARPGTALEELPATAVPGLAASVCVGRRSTGGCRFSCATITWPESSKQPR